MRRPTHEGTIASLAAERRDIGEGGAARRALDGERSDRTARRILMLARVLERNWPLSAALILVIIIVLSVAKSG